MSIYIPTYKTFKSVLPNKSFIFQVLHFSYCTLSLASIQCIFEYCVELKVVNFGCSVLCQEALEWTVNNLPRKVEKLSLCSAEISDNHIRSLLSGSDRKITELDLYGTQISGISINIIIENLHSTLEFLDLGGNIHLVSNISDLKNLCVMSKLKVLNVNTGNTSNSLNRSKNLKLLQQLQKQLPNVTITESRKKFDSRFEVNHKLQSVKKFIASNDSILHPPEHEINVRKNCIKKSKFQDDNFPVENQTKSSACKRFRTSNHPWTTNKMPRISKNAGPSLGISIDGCKFPFQPLFGLD